MLFAVFLLIQVTVSFGVDPLVQLPNGLIRGRQDVTEQNKSYYAFEKIPYATPPVGDLRFKAPQPAQKWEGVLNTTYLDVSCYQEIKIGALESEDCLFVNVFTTRLPEDCTEDFLPVLVFIHGGAFTYGSGALYRGDRIVEQDVVYVTVNYRLGIFGFLSTQDEVIPGNNGLKDQLLALKWIHSNIKLFGGDPEKITIWGQSAGSASVAYQLLHQESQGLFRGAIAQSGSSISPWAYQRSAREIAFSTAALLNDSVSHSNNSATLRDYLLTVGAEDLRQAAKAYTDSINNPENDSAFQGIFWAPVLEVQNPDAFITKKMFGLIEAGNVVSVPLLLGITSEEILTLWTAEKIKQYLGAYNEHLDWVVPHDMGVIDDTLRNKLGNQIRDLYTQGEPYVKLLGNGVRMLSDNTFTRSVIKHAELHSKFAPTYFYQFSFDGLLGNCSEHYDGADSVGHAEDNAYIFCSGKACDISTYPEADQITSQRLVKLWTDFAKYLNPTLEPSELLQNVTWPLVTSDFFYLDINENLTIKNNPKEKTYRKWTDLYSRLNYTDFDTY